MGPNLSGPHLDLANPATPLATAGATDSTDAAGGAGVITAADDAPPTSGLNVTFDNLRTRITNDTSEREPSVVLV